MTQTEIFSFVVQTLYWFFLYGYIGWGVEVVYAAIKERRLVNRGFLCLIRIFAGFISGIRLCLTIVISLIIFVRISWHI